jgi:hypothetical protein
LGQPTNATTGPAILTANTFIPLGGFWLQLNSNNASEMIRFRANALEMQSAALSHINLDIQSGANIEVIDAVNNAPTIYLGTNLGSNDVVIQNPAGLFQIVETTQSAGFVYDTNEFKFGIKNLAPTRDLDIAGNFGIVHTTTGSTPVSTIDVSTNWDTTATVNAFNYEINAITYNAAAKMLRMAFNGTEVFTIMANPGQTVFQQSGLQLQTNSAGPGGISLNGSAPVSNTLSVSQGFNINQTNSGAGAMQDLMKITTASPFSPTSGSGSVLNIIGATMTVSSGNGVANWLAITPTINQTGSANGITRGLYINPTLTSAIDFRALEVTVGKVILPNITLGLQVLSGVQTLSINATHYIFNDSVTRTWTLPNNASAGNTIFIKNRSGVALTVAGPVGQTIYDQGSVTTLDIQPGDAYIFVFDGTYWNAE